MRTARSRTSGENLFDFFMAPSSQELEPPQNPGRFIFARAGVAIARSTLAQWVGQCGVQLQPLVDALRAEVLACPVLHADETPVQMLKPGARKTHQAYLWAYAAGRFEPLFAVIYDFCESRAGKHASAFLEG